MGQRSRRKPGRGAFFGEPNGLQPGDDVGNRRSFKQAAIPPDDLGNRREPVELMALIADDLGNRVDLPPTHEISGVLAEIDGRRRRKKGAGPLVRMGRYFLGGVNPLVSGAQPPARPVTPPLELIVSAPTPAAARDGEAADPAEGAEGGIDEEGIGRKKRRRRRRRDGREQVDGQAAQEVSERRAQRFFDFEEDDRFEYTLKSDAGEKCRDATEAVRRVLLHAGRDATVEGRLLEDRDRPKVIVTIEERGPAADLPPERRSGNAAQPLFALGNAALMALNYLVNKIVNRYPDDRIRLAILPKADEHLYLSSLAQHVQQHDARRDAGSGAGDESAADATSISSAGGASSSGEGLEPSSAVDEGEPRAARRSRGRRGGRQEAAPAAPEPAAPELAAPEPAAPEPAATEPEPVKSRARRAPRRKDVAAPEPGPADAALAEAGDAASEQPASRARRRSAPKRGSDESQPQAAEGETETNSGKKASPRRRTKSAPPAPEGPEET